jgi:cytochrome P450
VTFAVSVAALSARNLARDYRGVFKELAAQGDLVWLEMGQRRLLLVNHPECVREILVDRAQEFVKPSLQVVETGPPGQVTANEAIPVSEFRAALAKGMGASRLPHVLDAVNAAANEELSRWHDGLHFRLMPWMRRLAIAIVCRGAFGTSLSASETLRAEHTIKWMGQAPTVDHWTSRFAHRLTLKQRRRVVGFRLGLRLAPRLIENADLSEPTELTAVVNDLRRIVPTVTEEKRRALLIDLFLGAVAPLTQTGAWSLVRFANTQDAGAPLRKEWHSVLSSEERVTRATLPHLTYTEAFVREVTRLHPTNDRIMRDAICDTCVGGESVPALTRVIVNVNALHRDPHVFANANAFAPERWLNHDRRSFRSDYVAFGLGGRRCLGERIALTALTALLPILTRKWDLRLGRLRISSGSREQPSESMKATVWRCADGR